IPKVSSPAPSIRSYSQPFTRHTFWAARLANGNCLRLGNFQTAPPYIRLAESGAFRPSRTEIHLLPPFSRAAAKPFRCRKSSARLSITSPLVYAQEGREAVLEAMEEEDEASRGRPRIRARRRSTPGSPAAVIKRSAAVDYGEGVEEGDASSAASPAAVPFPSLTDPTLCKLGLLGGSSLEGTQRGDAADISTACAWWVGLWSKRPPIRDCTEGQGLSEGPIRIRTTRCDALSEQDIEHKFTSLSLAFKTDRITLGSRLELQQRQRDLAEKNVLSEIKQLKTTLNVMFLLRDPTDFPKTEDVMAY
ncbi:hypothetical protein J437_LFUL003627, partial [Ladona fulva]